MRGEVPAVVVGGTLNSLGVVRSLGRGRMPIYILDETRRCAAAWSRYGQFVSVSSLEGEPLVQGLAELAGQLGSRAVLILTAEQSVESISRHRCRLNSLYRFSLPAEDTVRMLMDKSRFQDFGERECLAVPRGFTLDAASDLQRLATLSLPLVLKPADKRAVLFGTCERAVLAETLASARAAVARLLMHTSRVLVQEWIDGLDSDIFFTLFSCDHDGNILGIFSGRKLLCSPPNLGSTAVCVAAPEAAEEISAQTRHFIRITGYRGLGSLEFKRERHSGRYVIVEPTVGRTDWQEEIATLCGMNLPLMTYRAALDHPLPQTDGADAPALSTRIAWRASAEHRMPFEHLQRRLRAVDGFFRWSDPLPAAYYYGYERLALRLWRRGVRMLSAASYAR